MQRGSQGWKGHGQHESARESHLYHLVGTAGSRQFLCVCRDQVATSIIPGSSVSSLPLLVSALSMCVGNINKGLSPVPIHMSNISPAIFYVIFFLSLVVSKMFNQAPILPQDELLCVKV